MKVPIEPLPVPIPPRVFPERLRAAPLSAAESVRVKSALARITRTWMETCGAFASSLSMTDSITGICERWSVMITALSRGSATALPSGVSTPFMLASIVTTPGIGNWLALPPMPPPPPMLVVCIGCWSAAWAYFNWRTTVTSGSASNFAVRSSASALASSTSVLTLAMRSTFPSSSVLSPLSFKAMLSAWSHGTSSITMVILPVTFESTTIFSPLI